LNKEQKKDWDEKEVHCQEYHDNSANGCKVLRRVEGDEGIICLSLLGLALEKFSEYSLE
jgi:hypothetical protein